MSEPGEPGRGIRCRHCGDTRWRVVWIRHRPDGRVIRRKECGRCGSRVTTLEKELGA